MACRLVHSKGLIPASMRSCSTMLKKRQEEGTATKKSSHEKAGHKGERHGEKFGMRKRVEKRLEPEVPPPRSEFAC